MLSAGAEHVILKGGISNVLRILIPNRAQNFNFPKSHLPPDGGCGRLFTFCRKVAGWPAEGGMDIVHELTGGTCARSTRERLTVV